MAVLTLLQRREAEAASPVSASRPSAWALAGRRAALRPWPERS
ncbi:MAG: hypothetical protein QM692_04965 [Thermomicrobiales bacterium]